MPLTSPDASSEAFFALRLAPRVGRRTLSGLTSTSGCPGEARCLTPSRSLPAAGPGGPPPYPNHSRRGRLAGQRERDAVVAGPLRHLPDVTAGRDQDRHKAVPQAVEGDAGDPSTDDARLPDAPRALPRPQRHHHAHRSDMGGSGGRLTNIEVAGGLRRSLGEQVERHEGRDHDLGCRP